MLKLATTTMEFESNYEEHELVKIKSNMADLKQIQIDLIVKLQLSKNHGVSCERRFQQELVYENQIKRLDWQISNLNQIASILGEEVAL